MGYILKKLTGKRLWKVQYQTYIGGRRVKDITEVDYLRLGLHSRMDTNQVRERIKQLNAQETIKRLESKRIEIGNRLSKEELELNSHFPEELLKSFEETLTNPKDVIHWRTAKKLILRIKLESIDWDYNKLRWYRLFIASGYSYSYIQKMVSILNRWGIHQAYHHKSYFQVLSYPTGVDKQRIVDSYENKGVTKESTPLTADLLQKYQASLKVHHYNWLYLSLWFGLRPSEVDSLLKPPGPKTYSLRDHTLWVYQSKLTGISSKDRLKPIPLKYQEQKDGILIIDSKNFKRPLNKTLKSLFGNQTTCYGGRKGFTDLMLARGNSLEAISSWLGHRSLDRTWRNYKDKTTVLWG